MTTGRHMMLQIEDCVDCLRCVYLDCDYAFELNHTSGQNSEQLDGLSTNAINMGWGGANKDICGIQY